MTGLLSLAATGLLVALGAWIAAGLLFRAAGAALAVGGLLLTATSGSPSTAIAALVGAALWLAGHWIYATRHHYYRSPLARRVFLRALSGRLDPTRRWGVPNIPPEARRRAR
ncbi:MAG TPA: hypothetical protein VMB51_16185 [Solirubrobacteraceae bacterium]|nr:hypothetical protein [Solirubrobacteraceae bacterium]